MEKLLLVFAGLALLGSYLYGSLHHKRFRQYAFFPQMPTSLILGHLKHVDFFIRTGKPNGHPDLAFAAMNEALGRPGLMFLDLRPFGPPMVVVRSHEVAEQVSKASKSLPYSLPKMPSVYGHMVHVTGRTSILATHSSTFLENLNRFSRIGGVFSLVELTGNLTFDIICSVVMDVDFGSQNTGKQSDFVRSYHELFETYASEQVDLPWFLTPRMEWKRQQLAKRVRSTLAAIIRDTFDNRQTETTKSRSILSLSLQGYVDDLTSQDVDEACDQISTFLFTGHDTTSILLSWMFYELSRAPHAPKTLRSELDDLFGPDSNPSTVCNKLLSNDGKVLLNSMKYAGTARKTEPGAGLTVHTPTGEYPLEGVNVYNCAIMTQRDPEVYGDTANYFMPERWLNETAEKIPASAWRAFERGPRKCIGQELANLEARIVVALVARRYEFSKVGTGELNLDEDGKPILDSMGYFKTASKMYPVSIFYFSPT
ncbi:cytochrome P450 [Annulohypoxylon stygium]|nr:cytochrome P450 [Annulohypoxylon stygium]